MKVKVYETVNDYKEFETSFKTIKEILSQIRFLYGQELYDKIIYNEYAYLISKGEEHKSLDEKEVFDIFTKCEDLLIIPKSQGEVVIAGFVTALLAKIIYYAIVAIVVIAVLAVAISFAISPDQSFNLDPAKDQASKESNLFNSATILNEQGGSVPLIYGNPFCGGVLISSSLTSTDIERP